MLDLAAKKLALLVATAVVAVNIWTGAPLLAVWVGSKAQGDSGLSMGAVFLVVVVLAVLVTALAMALTWLTARYDQLTGRKQRRRQTYPWLQSMRAERAEDVLRERGANAVEKAVVASVVAAVLAFEVWFFFFAGSSIG